VKGGRVPPAQRNFHRDEKTGKFAYNKIRTLLAELSPEEREIAIKRMENEGLGDEDF
jgi:hypothetical protein